MAALSASQGYWEGRIGCSSGKGYEMLVAVFITDLPYSKHRAAEVLMAQWVTSILGSLKDVGDDDL